MANFKNPSPKTIVKMAREKILDESMNDAIVFLMVVVKIWLKKMKWKFQFLKNFYQNN